MVLRIRRLHRLPGGHRTLQVRRAHFTTATDTTVQDAMVAFVKRLAAEEGAYTNWWPRGSPTGRPLCGQHHERRCAQ